MFVGVVNMEILLAVPPAVVTFDIGGKTVFPTAETALVALGDHDWFALGLAEGATCTKALAGNPPSVSASPALRA